MRATKSGAPGRGQGRSGTPQGTLPDVDTDPTAGLVTIGWREWTALPEWGVPHLKAKVDTGARTSSLHAFNLEWFEREGKAWVRFEIHPWQRSAEESIAAEAPVIDTRDVKNSSGGIDRRPIIQTVVVIAGHEIEAEVTLTRRDEMGFRMLIGREAIRRRFLVDSGRSYLGGRPTKAVRRKNRATP